MGSTPAALDGAEGAWERRIETTEPGTVEVVEMWRDSLDTIGQSRRRVNSPFLSAAPWPLSSAAHGGGKRGVSAGRKKRAFSSLDRRSGLGYTGHRLFIFAPYPRGDPWFPCRSAPHTFSMSRPNRRRVAGVSLRCSAPLSSICPCVALPPQFVPGPARDLFLPLSPEAVGCGAYGAALASAKARGTQPTAVLSPLPLPIHPSRFPRLVFSIPQIMRYTAPRPLQ